jgi:hypothetical protein
MASGERREAFGSSRCMLVHVAAATATAAAGISPKSAPAITSQRKMNHAARKAALDHHPPAVAPAGSFSLPKDPLIRKYLDRHRIALPGFAVLPKTGLAHLNMDSFWRECRSRRLKPGISLGAGARLRIAIDHDPKWPRVAPTSRSFGATVLDKLSLPCRATNAMPAGGSRYHLVRSWTRGIARGSSRHSLSFPGSWSTMGTVRHLPV